MCEIQKNIKEIQKNINFMCLLKMINKTTFLQNGRKIKRGYNGDDSPLIKKWTGWERSKQNKENPQKYYA